MPVQIDDLERLKHCDNFYTSIVFAIVVVVAVVAFVAISVWAAAFLLALVPVVAVVRVMEVVLVALDMAVVTCVVLESTSSLVPVSVPIWAESLIVASVPD